MGVRLSAMKAKVQEAHLDWDGERVDFAYKPNEFTMELADEISAAAEKEDLSMVSSMLAPIIVWWDVLDDQDERIEPSPDNMRRFPLNFLLRIMDAITKDQNPQGQEG